MNTLVVFNILSLNIFVYTFLCYQIHFREYTRISTEHTKMYYIANADDLGSVMIGISCKGENTGEYDIVLVENLNSV